MKKTLLFSIFLFSIFQSQAQVCNPDMSYANAGPGVYPFSIATPDCSDTLGVKTIVSITDTTVNITSPITIDVTIYYDSTRVVSVAGLPPGMSFGTDVDANATAFAPYGAWVNGGIIPNVTPAIGCVYVHGSPSAWQTAQLGGDTGVYILQVEYDARIVETNPDVSAFGVPNGTWLSDVNPSFGGGTITIQVPMDTDPITDLEVPTLSGNASAHLSTPETYTASSGAISYNWIVDGGTIQSGQGTDMATVLWDGGVAEGTITVEVGDGEGCTKAQTMDVAIAGLGIYGVSDSEIKIYPNPSHGILNIEMDQNTLTKLTLVDLTGKTVLNTGFNNSRHVLDVSSIKTGIYLLKIETPLSVSIGKLVVE